MGMPLCTLYSWSFSVIHSLIWSVPKNKTRYKTNKWQKCLQTYFSPSLSVLVLMSSQCGYIIFFDLFAHDQIPCTLELSSKELCQGKLLQKQWHSSSHWTFVVVVLANVNTNSHQEEVIFMIQATLRRFHCYKNKTEQKTVTLWANNKITESTKQHILLNSSLIHPS